jgi:hypothetical protein
MSFGEVDLGFFRPFHLIGPFGRLEHLICETLESVAISGLVLSLGVEKADVVQENFKFTWPGPVPLVASRSFDRVGRMICFPHLVMALGGVRLIRVARLLLLLLLSCVEGRLLS